MVIDDIIKTIISGDKLIGMTVKPNSPLRGDKTVLKPPIVLDIHILPSCSK